ncbi:MAG: L-lactate dehydrogenase [Caldilineaceae bacterium]
MTIPQNRGQQSGKIGIIGSGFVGSTAAYAMVMRGVGGEIVLVDLNRQRAEAEANDIFHAVPFAHPYSVRAGDYADLAGARVVVITAGVNQKPGESRLELLARNAAVFRQVVPNILHYAPNAILVVATNPVDIMTHYTAQLAQEQGVTTGRIFGSGTTLDTARFRTLLGRHLGVDAQHVHAYVIGEHGDSEVLTWSLATVGGMPLAEFCQQQGLTLDATIRASIDQQVRRAAYQIIEGKGATYYGIGSALARIVDAILRDQRAILTVCAPHAVVAGVADVTLALPQLVGGQGILATFPQPLSAEEQTQLQQSAQFVKNAIVSVQHA